MYIFYIKSTFVRQLISSYIISFTFFSFQQSTISWYLKIPWRICLVVFAFKNIFESLPGRGVGHWGAHVACQVHYCALHRRPWVSYLWLFIPRYNWKKSWVFDALNGKTGIRLHVSKIALYPTHARSAYDTLIDSYSKSRRWKSYFVYTHTQSNRMHIYITC